MAVDKGGLEYTIKVNDQFTASLDRFDQGLRDTRRELGQFQNDLQAMSATAPGLQRVSRALQGLGSTAGTKKLKQASDNLRTLSANLGELNVKSGQLGQVQSRIAAVAAATRGIGTGRGLNTLIVNIGKFAAAMKGLQLSPVIANINQLAGAIQNLGNKAALANPALAALAGHLRRIQGAAAPVVARVGQVGRALNATAGQARGAQTTFGNLTASLRRLLVAYVAFRAFSAGTGAFSSLIGEGIKFNRTLEDAQLSLAAIFSNAGKVRNEQGQLTSDAEAFAIAQTVAAEQMAKLRLDAVSTTATIQELTLAFQQGVAPGLQAGLDPDQIRQVTVLLSRAAGTLGIAGDQFAEEVRSIISGTGEKRTTRLLSVLPEDFNKQLSRLETGAEKFQFLIKSFEQFQTLGEKVSETFSAKLGRITDALQIALGDATLGLFQEAKNLLDLVFNSLVQVDEKLGTITPRPEAVLGFQAIADGISGLVEGVEDFIKSLDVDDVKFIGIAIAEGFKLLGVVVPPILKGIIQTINQVARVAAFLYKTIRSIFEAIGPDNISKVVNLAGALLETILDNVQSGLQGLFDWAVNAFVGVGQFIASLGKYFDLLNGGASETGQKLRELGQEIIDIANGIKALSRLPVTTPDREEKFPKGTIEGRGSDPFDSGKIEARTQKLKEEAAATSVLVRAKNEVLVLEAKLAQGEFVRRRDLDIARAQEQATIAQQELNILKAKNRLAEEELRFKIRSKDISTTEAYYLRLQLQALQEQSKAEEDLLATKLVSTGIALKRLNDEASRPIELGIQTAIQNLDLDPFTEVVNFMESAIQGLSATISQALLDGFLDPQADIKESFSKLFRGLAQQLLQLIVQALLVKAISGIGGAVGFSEGGGVGLARGGKVPQRGKASAQHYGKNAKSFAIGGRPKGVPASDTVPAWLTPGEWVMRLSSVMKYGPRVMAAINEGRADPAVLQSAIKTGPVRSSKGPGYATGGRVASSRSAPTPAILVVGEQEAGRILDAGKRQLIAIMRDSAPEVNAALGRRG